MEKIIVRPDGIKEKNIFDPRNFPQVEVECNKHGKYITTKFPWGMIPLCPACIEESEQSEKKECKVSFGEMDFEEMNITPMYYEESFDTFITNTDEQKHHLRIVKALCEAGRGKILMIGNNGTGKTHLATAAVKYFHGVIYTMYEINLRLRRTYENGVNKEAQELSKLIKKPLLVIDEVGKTKGSDWEVNWLSHVINKRHEHFKPTIIISNLHYSKQCPNNGNCSQCIENYMGNDVLSRFSEDGMVLTFSGNDWRPKKRECRNK